MAVSRQSDDFTKSHDNASYYELESPTFEDGELDEPFMSDNEDEETNDTSADENEQEPQEPLIARNFIQYSAMDRETLDLRREFQDIFRFFNRLDLEVFNNAAEGKLTQFQRNFKTSQAQFKTARTESEKDAVNRRLTEIISEIKKEMCLKFGKLRETNEYEERLAVFERLLVRSNDWKLFMRYHRMMLSASNVSSDEITTTFIEDVITMLDVIRRDMEEEPVQGMKKELRRVMQKRACDAQALIHFMHLKTDPLDEMPVLMWSYLHGKKVMPDGLLKLSKESERRMSSRTGHALEVEIQMTTKAYIKDLSLNVLKRQWNGLKKEEVESESKAAFKTSLHTNKTYDRLLHKDLVRDIGTTATPRVRC